MPLTTVQQGLIGTPVVGTGPAFSAGKTSNQTIPVGTWTKSTFDIENFDTNNNFANSTFTPTVAGYYQINFGLDLSSSASAAYRAMLYKNGASTKYGSFIQTTTSIQTRGISVGSSLIYMNGSTDYLEIYAYIDAGTGPLIAGGDFTYFNGSLVRAA